MAQRVRYPDRIEPLVEFVEETTPERIVAATHDKLAAGTTVKDMLLASALAVVRSSDLPPGHHGGPLHPLCGLHAVHHISARLPGEYAMLPVIQNVAVANKHIHSPAMGPYMLADARPVSENDDVDATVKAFRTAVSRGVYNACDHYFLYLLERLSPMQILELLLEVGGSTLFLRSKTGNPMDVHINTGANTRRYLLRQPELSRRIKLQALLVWNTGPEVRMAQRMLASDVQPEPERVAALPSHTQDELLEEIESLISRLPVGERLPTAGLASWRSTDEVKHAAALAQQYADNDYAPGPLIDVLAKIACRDNFTEMHAFKHHQATYEEFYATRPSLRWRHLVAAVQASAISHGRIQDVFDHAAEVMHF